MRVHAEPCAGSFTRCAPAAIAELRNECSWLSARSSCVKGEYLELSQFRLPHGALNRTYYYTSVHPVHTAHGKRMYQFRPSHSGGGSPIISKYQLWPKRGLKCTTGPGQANSHYFVLGLSRHWSWSIKCAPGGNNSGFPHRLPQSPFNCNAGSGILGDFRALPRDDRAAGVEYLSLRQILAKRLVQNSKTDWRIIGVSRLDWAALG